MLGFDAHLLLQVRHRGLIAQRCHVAQPQGCKLFSVQRDRLGMDVEVAEEGVESIRSRLRLMVVTDIVLRRSTSIFLVLVLLRSNSIGFHSC